MEITSTIVWLGLLILFLAVEIATVGLTSIWFAGGALAGLLLDLAGLDVVWQIIAAVVVTVILLIFTRPFAVKFVNNNHEKTNYEGIIGKVIRITETVDNINQTGVAVLNGQEWTVRTVNDEMILVPDTVAKVVSISGVKLIVEEYKEDERE